MCLCACLAVSDGVLRRQNTFKVLFHSSDAQILSDGVSSLNVRRHVPERHAVACIVYNNITDKMKKNDICSRMTGTVHTVLSCFMMFLCCTALSSCGGDDDGGSGGGTTGSILDRLVGSEWKGEYFQVSENGEYEEGTMTLKFTSSDRAEQHTAYSGMEWNSNGEYVEYSGESDTFYEYVVSDGKITMTDTGGYGSFTLTPSGNNTLVYGSTVYRLVKEGTGDDTGGSQGGGDVGGNPETGIADFVTTPVRTFKMEFAQGSRDFKVEYVYSGNKVVRMLRSGSSSASYALSYSYDEVTAKSSAYTYTFGLGSTGYANFFRDGADGAWSCRHVGRQRRIHEIFLNRESVRLPLLYGELQRGKCQPCGGIPQRWRALLHVYVQLHIT